MKTRLRSTAAWILTPLFVSFSAPASYAGLSPKEIMKKSEEARRLKEVTSTCKLTQKSPKSEVKTKEFQWWRKISLNQIDYRTLVRFFAPPTVRGEGILISEKEGADNEVLLYLSAYKKIRRVENQQQTGKFMGSEFSYSDIATPHLEDYSYSGGSLGPCPARSGSTGTCYTVESKPSSTRVSERTGYSRMTNWLRTDNFMLVQAEFYDLQGTLYKRLIASEIEPAGRESGHWIAHHTEIVNLKTGSSSTIDFSEVRVNLGIAESTFTQQNLAAE